MVFYQVKTVVRLACGMLCGKTIGRENLATAKRELERNLRDAGISRSKATRIAGATLRYFKPKI